MKFCDQCAIITGIHHQQSVRLRFFPVFSILPMQTEEPDNTAKDERREYEEALHSFIRLIRNTCVREPKGKNCFVDSLSSACRSHTIEALDGMLATTRFNYNKLKFFCTITAIVLQHLQSLKNSKHSFRIKTIENKL